MMSPPKQHPLYRFIQRGSLLTSFNPAQLYLVLYAVLLLMTCTLAIIPARLITALIAGLSVSILAFSSTAYGVVFAFRVSQTVQRQIRQHNVDLLYLAPPGGVANDLIICAAALHRGRLFREIGELRKTIVGALLGIPLLLMSVIFVITLPSANLDTVAGSLRLMLTLLMLLLVLQIDHLQTIVLCGMLGVVVPHLRGDHTDTPLLAAIIFTCLQWLTYGAAAVLVLFEARFRLFTTVSPLLFAVVFLIGFSIPREAMILILWRTLTAHLNDHNLAPDETAGLSA